MTRHYSQGRLTLVPLVLIVLLVLCSGCFDVNQPAVYRCNGKEPQCPPGLVCSAGLCVHRVTADAAIKPDTGTDAVVDAAAPIDASAESSADAMADAGSDATADM